MDGEKDKIKEGGTKMMEGEVRNERKRKQSEK